MFLVIVEMKQIGKCYLKTAASLSLGISDLRNKHDLIIITILRYVLMILLDKTWTLHKMKRRYIQSLYVSRIISEWKNLIITKAKWAWKSN